MVEFKVEPIHQIIIHDLIHEDLENFLHQCYSVGSLSAIWVGGIIIDVTPLKSREIDSKQSIKGIKYFETITFVKYPKYAKKVKWNGGNYEIILRNYSNYARFIALAKWIKSQSVWEFTPEGLE